MTDKLAVPQVDLALLETFGDDSDKGQTNVCELRIVAKNGKLKRIRDYSQPVWNAHLERVARILGPAQEIARRKEVEESQKAVYPQAFARTIEIKAEIPVKYL